MYLFVVIFALASILQDQKIKDVISKHRNKTRKKFYNRIKKESEQELKVDDAIEMDQPFF